MIDERTMMGVLPLIGLIIFLVVFILAMINLAKNVYFNSPRGEIPDTKVVYKKSLPAPCISCLECKKDEEDTNILFMGETFIKIHKNNSIIFRYNGCSKLMDVYMSTRGKTFNEFTPFSELTSTEAMFILRKYKNNIFDFDSEQLNQFYPVRTAYNFKEEQSEWKINAQCENADIVTIDCISGDEFFEQKNKQDIFDWTFEYSLLKKFSKISNNIYQYNIEDSSITFGLHDTFLPIYSSEKLDIVKFIIFTNENDLSKYSTPQIAELYKCIDTETGDIQIPISYLKYNTDVYYSLRLKLDIKKVEEEYTKRIATPLKE